MPQAKLTKARIERIKAPDPGGKQIIFWDTELPGFGLLVSGRTTAKTYIAQRRSGGRSRRVTLGATREFPDVDKARDEAGKRLLELRQGKDPTAERRKEASHNRTLRDALDAYLKANKQIRQRTRVEYARAAVRHLAPWLDRPLRELTREQVAERYEVLCETTGPASANNAMRLLRLIWNAQLDLDGTLPSNPVGALKKQWVKLEPRSRMVPPEELPAFYAAVDSLTNRTAADYLKLLLFTGLRRQEAAALRWQEIDFATRVIRLPPSRTKANRRLDLPMSSFVRDLLVARRALGREEGGWVFGADSRSRVLTWRGSRACKEAPYH